MNDKSSIFRVTFCCILLLITSHVFAQNVGGKDTLRDMQDKKNIPVTWENFVRAETHKTFKNYASIGGFGKFFHIRTVTPLDKQDVIRMNRDTRYSIGVFDLTNPLTVTLPDTKGRFISMQVINEDEYTKAVDYNTW